MKTAQSTLVEHTPLDLRFLELFVDRSIDRSFLGFSFEEQSAAAVSAAPLAMTRAWNIGPGLTRMHLESVSVLFSPHTQEWDHDKASF